jgi:hypothetical protein
MIIHPFIVLLVWLWPKVFRAIRRMLGQVGRYWVVLVPQGIHNSNE